MGRNWGGARNVQDRSLQGAGQEYGRGGAAVGAGEEQRAGETMTMTTKTMMMKTGHYQERERERHKAARGSADTKGSAFGQHKAVLLSTFKYS